MTAKGLCGHGAAPHRNPFSPHPGWEEHQVTPGPALQAITIVLPSLLMEAAA